MAQHNTHRAPRRATSPALASRTARTAGGAALLGAVLLGSAGAFGSADAQAAPAPAATSAPAAQASAPAQAAPTAALDTTRTLRYGSRGAAVSDLQKALNANGASLAVDGKFGPRTRSAVKDYQASNGLAIDGIVGPKTRGSLNGGGGSITGGAGASGGRSASSTSGLVSTARAQVGTGYTYGGNSPSEGFDCSGLVNYVYAQHGIDLPRTSGGIADGGRWISRSEAKPGDIVVWSGHVAIYAGDGQIIDASGSKRVVTERAIWGSPKGFVTYR